jgi:hypothetical protein
MFTKARLLTAAAAAAAVLAVVAGTGIAMASIPDSGGVIHACYKPNANGSNAPLGVIDTARSGGHCPGGDKQLTWNQTAALTTQVVTAQAAPFPGGTTATATCPTGTTVTGGGFSAGTAAGAAVGESFPDGNAWTAVMTGGPSGAVLTVYAVCGSV